MDHSNYFEVNKAAWDKRTIVNRGSEFYDVDSFKAGKSSLNPLEIESLKDVRGKSMLHLQCHFGLDTLSWAREGAIVTGIDLSDEAIRTAKQLSADLDIPAEFISCNVYDTLEHIRQPYDIVFTTYGVIGWLPDLQKWAHVISKALKPGGIFFLAEFHPVLWMFDDDFEYIKYAYHNEGVIAETQTGTYADRSADITYHEYSWNHSLSEVMTALIGHGLLIAEFTELNYSYYNCFNKTIRGENGYWYIKGLENKIPMTYAIKARKT